VQLYTSKSRIRSQASTDENHYVSLPGWRVQTPRAMLLAVVL
jgi:hypothetical protein